jgi:hypothetical protein
MFVRVFSLIEHLHNNVQTGVLHTTAPFVQRTQYNSSLWYQ